MYIKIKHTSFFFNVISLKFNFRSTQIALELQPLCLDWNRRIFTVRFSGGAFFLLLRERLAQAGVTDCNCSSSHQTKGRK